MDHFEQQVLIEAALAEDMAYQDLTALATISEEQQGQAIISSKANGILSGCGIAQQVFKTMNASLQQTWCKKDGDAVQVGDIICIIKGSMRNLLSAERTALNFIQHMSGIATATNAYVRALKGTSCVVVDTRKTTPGLRALEKKSVRDGGGQNHRLDLASGMLIKENHIEGAGSITDAVAACEKFAPDVWIEVECETLDEVREASIVCPDIILLDNMDIPTVIQARNIVPDSILLEASGNITLDNAREYAGTGINRIAVGAITHSTHALDLSMRVSCV